MKQLLSPSKRTPIHPGDAPPTPSSAAASACGSAVPLVTPLRDLDSFNAWEASLLANLRFHGLDGFLQPSGEPKPPHTESLAFVQ